MLYNSANSSFVFTVIVLIFPLATLARALPQLSSRDNSYHNSTHGLLEKRYANEPPCHHEGNVAGWRTDIPLPCYMDAVQNPGAWYICENYDLNHQGIDCKPFLTDHKINTPIGRQICFDPIAKLSCGCKADLHLPPLSIAPNSYVNLCCGKWPDAGGPPSECVYRNLEYQEKNDTDPFAYCHVLRPPGW